MFPCAQVQECTFSLRGSLQSGIAGPVYLFNTLKWYFAGGRISLRLQGFQGPKEGSGTKTGDGADILVPVGFSGVY